MTPINKPKQSLTDYATAAIIAAMLLGAIAVQQMPTRSITSVPSHGVGIKTSGLNRQAVMPSTELNKGHIDRAIGPATQDTKSHTPGTFGAVYTMPSAPLSRHAGTMT